MHRNHFVTLPEPHGQPGHFGHLFLRGTYDATTKVGVSDDRGEGWA